MDWSTVVKQGAACVPGSGAIASRRGTQRCIAIVCAVLLGWQADRVAAEDVEPRDGRHDFDFETGTWTTHLRRLENPLSGSTTWVEYQGTSVVSKVWGGRANLVELDVEGPAGRIEGLSLRLYNPQSRQWSLNFANSRSGVMTEPVIGEFRNGRGEFYGQDTLNGRAIFVRFVISPVDATSWRFEQAFSEDGGKTWEVNWIAIDTRVPDAAGTSERPGPERLAAGTPCYFGCGRLMLVIEAEGRPGLSGHRRAKASKSTALSGLEK